MSVHEARVWPLASPTLAIIELAAQMSKQPACRMPMPQSSACASETREYSLT